MGKILSQQKGEINEGVEDQLTQCLYEFRKVDENYHPSLLQEISHIRFPVLQ